MDEEKGATIQNFSDMVNATEKLTKPWRWALIITNLLWAIVFTVFIMLAYLTPVEYNTEQNQDFSSQVQNYSSSFTDGG